MPKPLTPNDDARNECIADLALIRAQLETQGRTTINTAIAAQKALHKVGMMLTRMDMDDVCYAIDELMTGRD